MGTNLPMFLRAIRQFLCHQLFRPFAVDSKMAKVRQVRGTAGMSAESIWSGYYQVLTSERWIKGRVRPLPIWPR